MKLKIAFGARLVDCYQSWQISRENYTPSKPITSSSENELGEANRRGRSREAGNQRESRTGETGRYRES